MAARRSHVIATNGDELVDVVTGAPDRILALFELPERLLPAGLNELRVEDRRRPLKAKIERVFLKVPRIERQWEGAAQRSGFIPDQFVNILIFIRKSKNFV